MGLPSASCNKVKNFGDMGSNLWQPSYDVKSSTSFLIATYFSLDGCLPSLQSRKFIPSKWLIQTTLNYISS